MKEGGDEENGWISVLISTDPTYLTDAKYSLGKSDSRGLERDKWVLLRKSANWFL